MVWSWFHQWHPSMTHHWPITWLLHCSPHFFQCKLWLGFAAQSFKAPWLEITDGYCLSTMLLRFHNRIIFGTWIAMLIYKIYNMEKLLLDLQCFSPFKDWNMYRLQGLKYTHWNIIWRTKICYIGVIIWRIKICWLVPKCCGSIHVYYWSLENNTFHCTTSISLSYITQENSCFLY